MMLNCIVLGDAPSGFEELETFLNETPFTYLASRCSSMQEAATLLTTSCIHLLVIGNHVAEMETALEPRDELPVLIMSYPDNGPDPFIVYHAEIIHLPFTYTRFYDTFRKIYNLINMEGEVTCFNPRNDHFMLRCGHRHEKICYHHLQYVEVMDDHILLHLTDQKIATTEKLDWIISQLPLNAFMHVHRWFVVGFRHVTQLGRDHLFIGDTKIPVAAHASPEVARRYRKRWES